MQDIKVFRDLPQNLSITPFSFVQATGLMMIKSRL
jgi:hypothetical protein